MNPYPGPRSVLIMNNCVIHKGEEVQALFEDIGRSSSVSGRLRFFDNVSCIRTGARIGYRSPYSPDFNPIEESFSTLKRALRKRGIFGDLVLPCLTLAKQQMSW
jgi:transposase